MTTTTASPVERLAWLDTEITKLTARQQRLDEQLSGRSLKSDFTKLAGVREERMAVVEELEELTVQQADARRQEQEERRAANQRQSEIASARAGYDAITPELRAAFRFIHSRRLTLVSYGEPDPGDKVFSVEAIVAPLLEAEARANAVQRAALTAHWATPEQAAADNRRRARVSDLMNHGRTQEDAGAIADLMEAENLDEETATARYDAPEEETDAEAMDE